MRPEIKLKAETIISSLMLGKTVREVAIDRAVSYKAVYSFLSAHVEYDVLLDVYTASKRIRQQEAGRLTCLNCDKVLVGSLTIYCSGVCRKSGKSKELARRVEVCRTIFELRHEGHTAAIIGKKIGLSKRSVDLYVTKYRGLLGFGKTKQA